jgi:hypothetical protein
MNRSQLFWGGVLLLVGGLMLAGELGVRLPNGNSLLSLFWPLLLIGFGIWVLLSVFMRGRVEAESASIALQNAREASVRINHGAGELRLHSGASSSELLNGTFTGGLDHKSNLSGEKLEVKMQPSESHIMFPPFGWKEQLNWDVAFNPSVPISLDLNLGANKSEINLKDMTVTDIRLKSGASDTSITVPSQGRLTLDCEIGAASLTIIVPDGVAIRVRASMGAGDVKVDRTRFPNNESPDFGSAQNAVEINVKGGAASVRIK